MKKTRRRWIIGIISLVSICLLASLISALLNRSFTRVDLQADHLLALDKVRLEEAQQLRDQIGDQVFPGWGSAPEAQIVYNREQVFLVNLSDPADGWIKVPHNIHHGQPWIALPTPDMFADDLYYRQPYVDDQSPEAFAVRIGSTYVGSLPTFEWMQYQFMEQLRSNLPGFIKPIVPYPLLVNLFLPDTDTYLSLIQHENFHAFQGTWAQERFNLAEKTNINVSEEYPWHLQSNQTGWESELETLQSALKSEEREETALLVHQFLQLRDQRREESQLSARMISFENQREWLEGMARYAELESWRLAGSLTAYQPISDMHSDPDFNTYAGFSKRWNRELQQMTRMADDEGDGRFYYSGMAQAFLLDRLQPGWKDHFYADPTLNLEDLLREVIINN